MRSKPANWGLAALALAIAVGSIAQTVAAAEEVNVYSYRQPDLVDDLFAAFTKETGIEVNIVYSSSGLEERLAQEGVNSPADVLFTVDIGRLQNARDLGVTQPVTSEAVRSAIPSAYRDPEGHWIGLTVRGRVVYASNERAPQKSITYEELADPKWKGRICTRSGQHVYNIALFASMIAHHGEAKAKEWLAGLKANLARKPAGSDRAQVKGIYSGECDISLGNTYYMGAMMMNEKEPEQKQWAAAARIIFPNNETRGTHVNISGVAMAKHAPHPGNARKLIEWLVGKEAQEIYAEVVNEYPLRAGTEASALVKSWGEIKMDTLPVAEIAGHRKRASELVDEVGYDDGPSS